MRLHWLESSQCLKGVLDFTEKAEYKILVIDDDPDFISSTKTVLETRPDFKVLTASDPVFAYPMAIAERPDLIILDVIMSFEDGFSAARKFKSEPGLSDIPIIILTSFSHRLGESNIAVADGMDFVADDYMEKPVNPAELLKRVSEMLDKSERNI